MVLLVAVGTDGMNNNIPLAWGLVPRENEEYWSYFMVNFKMAFPSTLNQHFVIISDRQKGLIGAVKQYYPTALHLHCCQHLADNLAKAFGGVNITPYFWRIARSTSKGEFDEGVAALKVVNPRAAEYLVTIPHGQWAAYAVNRARYGIDTSNMVESQNAKWIAERTQGPLESLINLWNGVAGLCYERSVRQNKNSTITDYAATTIRDNNLRVPQYSTISTGTGKGSTTRGGKTHIVDILARSCTCKLYSDVHLPCTHALAVCLDQAIDPYLHIGIPYQLCRYREAYSMSSPPLRFEDTSVPPPGVPWVRPPIVELKKGRRRTKRIRRGDRWKKIRALRCSICKEKGHNKRMHGPS